MREYVKKIVITFLVICMIFSTIDISVFQTLAAEGEKIEEQINQTNEEQKENEENENNKNKTDENGEEKIDKEETKEEENKENLENKEEETEKQNETEEKSDNMDEKQEEQEENETKENIIEESENLIKSNKNKKMKNSISNEISNAIYLDGQNGNDDNNGLTEDQPVESFDKVKSVLNDNENIDTVYILGTVTITGIETWELPEGITVKRKVADCRLVEVNNNAKLTLKNIVLDGQKDTYKNETYLASSLIYVADGGLLTIEDGTKLKNNDAGTYSLQEQCGGAIDNRGKVIMNGGEISENIAYCGGGINVKKEAEFILNDGIITSNTASNDKYSDEGGGVFVYGASFIMNGGEISNNHTTSDYGRGGGIAATSVYTSFNGITFTMNGGVISGNSATSGGGIYVECDTKVYLQRGEIENNRCPVPEELTSGQYGGAGVYVNGGKSQDASDGYLHISSAYISGNEAKKYDGEGSGIAGCGTSTVTIHENAATICGNKGKSQVFVDRYVNPAAVAQGGDTARSKVNIALHSLGGYANHWKSETGEEVLSSDLNGEIPENGEVSITDNAITSLEKTKSLANVIITGNISNTRGGGIGTNGEIEIGDDPTLIEGNVTKKWLDSNAKDGIRPDSITVNLYANGILIDSVTISEETNWKYKFENLVLADKYDKKIEYTIEEVLPNGYKASINDNNIEDSTITNTQVISLDVTKKWKDDNNKYGTRPDSITVKLYANGKFVRSQKITKKGGWKYTFKDLAKYDENGKEIKYTVKEEKVKGYETSIEGTNITNTHKEIKPPKTGGVLENQEVEEYKALVVHTYPQILPIMLLVVLAIKSLKLLDKKNKK